MTQSPRPSEANLSAALDYARRGWPVIPLHTVSGGRCTCRKADCRTPGKHPLGVLVKHGLREATTDEERISEWWRRRPEANIGVVTGPRSELVVLDVDPRHGGDASLARLIEDVGALPATLASATGGGGTHRIYRHPGRLVKSVSEAFGAELPGLDIKGDGGYFVAPPSLHVTGSRYQWIDAEAAIVAFPETLARRLSAAKRERQEGDGAAARERGAANDELEHVSEGKRNSMLASLAGKLRSQGMDQAAIESTLLVYNAAHCEPPLDEDEVQTIAASISRYPAGDRHRKSVSTLLVELAEGAELFHTPEGEAYATMMVGEHRETWSVRSRQFRHWLSAAFYRTHGTAARAQALQDAISVLEARALHEGAEQKVWTRIAEHEGALYLDLANAGWEAVEITADGWRVMAEPPVRFRRKAGMAALPIPRRGGSIEALRAFVNVGGEEDWRLMVAWLAGALRPRGPYPILVLQGEQGSAKSTTARLLRSLVDPSSVPLRTLPRNEHDLMIAASNAWVQAFDNLSGLSPWMADGLCRLATGGGFGTRELYSDADEVLFEATRPVILNGIDEIATRQDLADRALILTLPVIGESSRRSEAVFWREFEAARPGMLGALLDAVSAALRRQAEVQLAQMPRMADFAVWATAAERGLGWADGAFMQAYAGNRAEAAEAALEANAVASEVRRLLEERQEWSGTASDLLAELTRRAPEQIQKSRRWPTSPQSLSNQLNRAAPALRMVGIEVHRRRDGKRRELCLGYRAETCVTSVTNVTADEDEGMQDVTMGDEPVTLAALAERDASPMELACGPTCDARDACDDDLLPNADVVLTATAGRGQSRTRGESGTGTAGSIASANGIWGDPSWWPRVIELESRGMVRDLAIQTALREKGAL